MGSNEVLQTIQTQKTTLGNMIDELDSLEEKIRESLSEKNKLRTKITELQQEIEELSQKVQEKEIELVQLRTEQAIHIQEAELLRKKFEEASELYQEGMDAQELLTIYITLLEKVFGAKPHAKILYVLHGESETISRDALNKSLGFEPAVVLRAIHELQSADLVDYDDQQNKVTLKRRLYKK